MATRIIPLIPDDAAGDFWWRRTKPKTRVGPDDAFLQLPHGLACIQALHEDPHAYGDENSQRCVEDEVEEQDFICEEMKKIIRQD